MVSFREIEIYATVYVHVVTKYMLINYILLHRMIVFPFSYFHRGEIKLADFGLARLYEADERFVYKLIFFAA